VVIKAAEMAVSAYRSRAASRSQALRCHPLRRSMSFCAMAEDMAARWMGDSGIFIAEVRRRIRVAKS
jgi:hypothetical protein